MPSAWNRRKTNKFFGLFWNPPLTSILSKGEQDRPFACQCQTTPACRTSSRAFTTTSDGGRPTSLGKLSDERPAAPSGEWRWRACKVVSTFSIANDVRRTVPDTTAFHQMFVVVGNGHLLLKWACYEHDI
jgi:hypothetical protein